VAACTEIATSWCRFIRLVGVKDSPFLLSIDCETKPSWIETRSFGSDHEYGVRLRHDPNPIVLFIGQ
jgi:hypothetical protein